MKKRRGRIGYASRSRAYKTMRVSGGLLRADMTIDLDRLKDFVSDCLAVERGGVKLYTQCVAQTEDPEEKERLETFLFQTKDQAALLEGFIVEQGWDIAYKSEGALAAEELSRTLPAQSVSDDTRRAKMFEKIVIAETKDHLDWNILSEIARLSRPSQLGGDLKEMTSRVEGEEDEHLKWSQKKLYEAALAVLAKSVPASK